MSSVFYGLTMKSNFKYEQHVSRPFHISHVALDWGEHVKLYFTIGGKRYLMATLGKTVPQVQLHLKFSPGDKLTFEVVGEGKLSLLGYMATVPQQPLALPQFDDEAVQSYTRETRMRVVIKNALGPKPRSRSSSSSSNYSSSSSGNHTSGSSSSDGGGGGGGSGMGAVMGGSGNGNGGGDSEGADNEDNDDVDADAETRSNNSDGMPALPYRRYPGRKSKSSRARKSSGPYKKRKVSNGKSGNESPMYPLNLQFYEANHRSPMADNGRWQGAPLKLPQERGSSPETGFPRTLDGQKLRRTWSSDDDDESNSEQDE
ncbi:hypothetical protein KR222_006047 [Zaprionus bogoriensis]|nr:hypothetical protein KR222_006047 [Zaprionus bogoriensis]